MSNPAWKKAERRAAAIFGTKRQRCSGSSGRADETRSDSTHPVLFLETKHRERHTARTLYDETKEKAVKEGKIPVIALADKGRKGFLLCVHSDDLVAFCAEVLAERDEVVEATRRVNGEFQA